MFDQEKFIKLTYQGFSKSLKKFKESYNEYDYSLWLAELNMYYKTKQYVKKYKYGFQDACNDWRMICKNRKRHIYGKGRYFHVDLVLKQIFIMGEKNPPVLRKRPEMKTINIYRFQFNDVIITFSRTDKKIIISYFDDKDLNHELIRKLYEICEPYIKET